MPNDPTTKDLALSAADQERRWVEGESIHNTERDECCPDFSCCQPALKWTPEQRREFHRGSEALREEMLYMALGAAFAHAGKRDDVHIAGHDGRNEA